MSSTNILSAFRYDNRQTTSSRLLLWQTFSLAPFPCHSTRYISSSYSKIKTKTNVSMPFYTVDIMSLILIIFIVPKFMTAQCTSLHNCNHHNLDDFAIKVCIIIIIIIILAYQGVRPCGLLARWAWAHPLWSLVTLLNQFHASIIGHLIFHMLSAQVI